MKKYSLKSLRYIFKNIDSVDRDFIDDYKLLIYGNALSREGIIKMMKFIAFLLVTGDNHLTKMAYYLSIRLGIITKDFTILRDISNRLGYYPVIALTNRIKDNSNSESCIANSIFSEVLALTFKNNYYRTEEQYYFDNNVISLYNVRAIAPTSYGKSQLIIGKCIDRYNNNEKTCIVIPTKSLLSQTVSELVKYKGNRNNVITHPDMMTKQIVNQPHISILTQERLMAILTSYTNISYDYLFVDEAHNLLENDQRAKLLARDIIILKARNPKVCIDYFSPFIASPDTSLDIVNIKDRFSLECIDEFVKVPRYYIWNEADGQVLMYDQFINDFYELERARMNIFSATIEFGGSKNIIYANKPSDVEQIADALADEIEEVSFCEESEAKIEKACKAISIIIHDSYNLQKLLKHGIVISHGRMMDIVRNYIEYLFKDVPELKYIITTSTLLEGVNIPAEVIFIYDFRKGKQKLSYSSFHNLVGRICRFRDIFKEQNTNVELLMPKIYLMQNSRYMHRGADSKKYFRSVAKEDFSRNDEILNPLLKEYNGEDKNERRIDETNILGNIDAERKDLYIGIGNAQPVLAQTDFGKSCFKNGVNFFDIFSYEVAISQQLDKISCIENVDMLVKVISRYILGQTYNPVKKDWIYKFFINDILKSKISSILRNRSSGEFNFAKLIAGDINQWKKLVDKDGYYIAYVGKIGDCNKNGETGRINNFHKFERGIENLMVSYAVSLEKENLDNIDYNFMPIVDTLNDLGKIDESFYERLKYGTDNDFAIKLIQLGLDLSLARMIADDPSLRKLFKEDDASNLLYCIDKKKLLDKMLEADTPVIYIKSLNDLL